MEREGEGGADLLMSHHDVVEANGDWEHPPFSGELDEQGRLWGRGTVDTKASLFCILTRWKKRSGKASLPEGDVYIASGCTEEFSGEGAPLTAAWLKEQGVHLKFLIDEGGMILDEPIGGVKGTYAMVGVLEKGYGDLKFTARGKGGHASAPGRNTPLVPAGTVHGGGGEKISLYQPVQPGGAGNVPPPDSQHGLRHEAGICQPLAV